jgi:hypothetical protein
LRITNQRGGEAGDIQVQLLELRRTVPGGSLVRDSDFLPLNLKWSHTVPPISTRPHLLPGLFAHCDFCHVFGFDPGLLYFDTDVEPAPLRDNVYATTKPPGDYEVDIAVSGTNAKLMRATISIHYTGEWLTDQATMFDDALRLEVK